MPSRSENIWRQASEFKSGKFSHKHLFGDVIVPKEIKNICLEKTPGLLWKQ